MKALIDLGEPDASLESTGDNNPDGTIPLLLLAYIHPHSNATRLQIWDKIALLLSRGADVKARNSRGETCLHLALAKPGSWDLSDTKVTLILIISAEADVCADDNRGETVTDVAIRLGTSGMLDRGSSLLRY